MLAGEMDVQHAQQAERRVAHRAQQHSAATARSASATHRRRQRSLVAVLAIGVLIVVGVLGWQRYREQQALAARREWLAHPTHRGVIEAARALGEATLAVARDTLLGQGSNQLVDHVMEIAQQAEKQSADSQAGGLTMLAVRIDQSVESIDGDVTKLHAADKRMAAERLSRVALTLRQLADAVAARADLLLARQGH